VRCCPAASLRALLVTGACRMYVGVLTVSLWVVAV
jgi:hypothetical protein